MAGRRNDDPEVISCGGQFAAELAGLGSRHGPHEYAQLASQVKHDWDIWLYIPVALGFVLIAMAMAYAIIDVPSTGNARLSQRRFLEFRQLPLVLASLVFIMVGFAAQRSRQ